MRTSFVSFKASIASALAFSLIAATLPLSPEPASALDSQGRVTCLTQGGMADALSRVGSTKNTLGSKYRARYDLDMNGTLDAVDTSALAGLVDANCADSGDDLYTTLALDCIMHGGMGDFMYRFGSTKGTANSKYLAKYDTDGNNTLDAVDQAALGGKLQASCGATLPVEGPTVTCVTNAEIKDFEYRFGSTKNTPGSRYRARYDLDNNLTLDSMDFMQIGGLLQETCAGSEDDLYSSLLLSCITDGGMGDFQYRFGSTKGTANSKYLAKYDTDRNNTLDATDMGTLGGKYNAVCSVALSDPVSSSSSSASTTSSSSSSSSSSSGQVTICHNGNTINVGTNAVQSHLNHGDTLGACPAPLAPQAPAPQPIITPTPKTTMKARAELRKALRKEILERIKARAELRKSRQK